MLMASNWTTLVLLALLWQETIYFIIAIDLNREPSPDPVDDRSQNQIDLNRAASMDPAETHSDRKSTRLNSSHSGESRMPSSA